MHARTRRAVGLVLLLSALLLVAADPGYARTLSVEDVIRLHFAGVSEDVIISELIVTDSEFELSVDELVRLKDAGLSDRLLKFMIDTALPSEDDEELALTAEEDPWADEEGYGQIWENVIVEEEAASPEYFATLNWNYPAWYYDSYWYDYWYWDCGYAPYRSSWCVSFGAWYPGWYTCRTAWAIGSWGYGGCSTNYAYNQGWNQGYAWGYQDGWDDAGGGGAWPQGLSDVKYKAGSGTGKVIYTNTGLGLGDVQTLTKKSGRLEPGPRKVRTEKVLVADTRHGRLDTREHHGSRTRPIRISSADSPQSHSTTKGTVRTATHSNGKVVTDRVTTRRPTRQAAGTDRPVVTRRPKSTGRTKVETTPRRKPSGKTVAPSTPKRTTPRVKSTPTRKTTPQVKSAPQTRRSPQVKATPVRQRSAPPAAKAPAGKPRASAPKSRGGR